MISMIIPCYWATGELFRMTVRCLDSLNDTTNDEPQEVLIIDDGSPLDCMVEDDTDFIQRFATLRREKNGGYAGAANMGLFHASGDILIVANNDLVFGEGWLQKLLYILDMGYDIATCWTSDQEVELVDGVEDDAKFGSLFAMKRTVYETLGGFDEQFRGYFSDLDYRRRALNAGFKIGKSLSLVVEHEGKATYKQTDEDDTEYLRSMRLYEAKWGEVE